MRRLLPMLTAFLLLASCGERIRFEDTIEVPILVQGFAAKEPLFERIPPELVEALGGVPDPWPESAPRLTEDLPMQLTVPVRHQQLAEVGEDLAQVGAGEAEGRLRWVRFTFDSRTLTHPIVSGGLWVTPDEETALDHEDAREIGYLAGLEAGVGEMIFSPGGRHALQDALTQPETVLVAQLLMVFDTATNRALPAGEGDLVLEVRVDILK